MLLKKSILDIGSEHIPFLNIEDDRIAAKRLETVIHLVTRGCQITLQNCYFAVLVPRLAEVDCLLPWKNRVRDFLDCPGSTYIYAVPLGAGMGLARLRRLDPVLGWIIIDGYGFHEGFFAHKRFIEKQEVPKRLSAYAHRVFDHGVGRAIWFIRSTNVERVARERSLLSPKADRPISGVVLGLYRGHESCHGRGVAGCGRSIQTSSGTRAAIAANARHEVGNPSPHA